MTAWFCARSASVFEIASARALAGSVRPASRWAGVAPAAQAPAANIMLAASTVPRRAKVLMVRVMRSSPMFLCA